MTEDNKAQKKGHFLDLKIPLGSLLSFYGLVLVLYGIFSGKAAYERSLGVNVNLIWGIVILAVGAGLLISVLIGRGRKEAKAKV